jgi:hypothetical protein
MTFKSFTNDKKSLKFDIPIYYLFEIYINNDFFKSALTIILKKNFKIRSYSTDRTILDRTETLKTYKRP